MTWPVRHGAMPALFGDLRAPSTLGSFLRSFTWGNVLQLQKVHRQFLAELARRAPLLPRQGHPRLYRHRLPAETRLWAPQARRRVRVHQDPGQGLLVRGLNVLAASICTPLAAPVVADTRLRGGNASSARGAASMITEAGSTARAAGWTGTIVVRMDSAFYGSPACSAARRGGTCCWSRRAWTPRSAPRSPLSARMPGRWSAILALSGMTSWAAGSPTARSRRCPIPRSPPARARR